MPGFPPLSPCRFAHWLRFDGWSVQQAAFILNGWEPPTLQELRSPQLDKYSLSATPPRWGDLFDSRWDDRTAPLMSPADWERALEVRGLYSTLAMAISCKRLPTLNHFEGSCVWEVVKPREAVQWAVDKTLDLPPELTAWLTGHTAETCVVASNKTARTAHYMDSKTASAIREYVRKESSVEHAPQHIDMVKALTEKYPLHSPGAINTKVKETLRHDGKEHLITGGSGRPKLK